ncbi:hypothetical protein SOASR030_07030 [Leminorella grimontii]|uniref:Uncharacterized protein n=1 Tax=Leminorella grimontii TaxID=82981 RepID=A0AAV5MXM3_9GAMM|nr:hypothetical protein SOASR030_07030 [Leminorella grimontii]GKX58009.1 hypothetical protein SOASR031_03240 [Leminorella grimontii]
MVNAGFFGEVNLSKKDVNANLKGGSKAGFYVQISQYLFLVLLFL